MMYISGSWRQAYPSFHHYWRKEIIPDKLQAQGESVSADPSERHHSPSTPHGLQCRFHFRELAHCRLCLVQTCTYWDIWCSLYMPGKTLIIRLGVPGRDLNALPVLLSLQTLWSIFPQVQQVIRMDEFPSIRASNQSLYDKTATNALNMHWEVGDWEESFLRKRKKDRC